MENNKLDTSESIEQTQGAQSSPSIGIDQEFPKKSPITRQAFLESLIYGVLLILFLGFIGGSIAIGAIVVDGLRSREASYTDLVRIITQQNNDIQNLTEKVNRTNLGLQARGIIPRQ